MSIEVTVAVIGATAAVIGTITGSAISILVTKAQLRSASRQVMVDQKRRIESRLESLLQEWTSQRVDVSGEVEVGEIHSRFVDSFLWKVQVFMGAAHHLPENLEGELQSLSAELNGYIFSAKPGADIDQEHAKQALKRMKALDARVPQRIRERLRELQSEMASLVQETWLS